MGLIFSSLSQIGKLDDGLVEVPHLQHIDKGLGCDIQALGNILLIDNITVQELAHIVQTRSFHC